MRQTGKVIETKGKKAVVRFVRSDACGHCNACFRLGSNEADIDIDNVLNAKIGDLVGIEMHGKSVLKASLILYGVPLVALLVGAYIGSLRGDLYAALGGVMFAAGSFFILRALEPKFSRMTEFKPRMVEIVEQPEGPEQPNEGGKNDGE
jgi:positive regulator of sigma E, rseC/mucC